MADVVFGQLQSSHSLKPYHRWARVIIEEHDYSDFYGYDSSLLFIFDDDNWHCSYHAYSRRYPVGISAYGVSADEFKANKEKMEKVLLKEEGLCPEAFLYTDADTIKEAFSEDYQNTMKLHCKILSRKQIIYWAACGYNDCAVLVAFEKLSEDDNDEQDKDLEE